MKTETLPLWSASRGIASTLTRHVRDDGIARPAVLVIPGGGYWCVCESTEGGPIANRFDELGYQTFVLSYRTAGDFQDNNADRAAHYPPLAALEDAVRAMRLIRGNAAAWGVEPSAIAACGFSAGGHLSAALGTIADAVPALNGDQFDAFCPVPDALLLCYPVILSNEYGHVGSRKNFFGGRDTSTAEDLLFSLDRHVTEKTPPAFLWTTLEDTTVPMENSLAFLSAMRGRKRPCDLHAFAHGPHGMQLGYGRHDIANWPQLASDFLRDTCGFRLPDAPCPGTVCLTFDDCPKNHLAFVAPLLKKYGFNATFFITRFDDGWRSAHGDTLLTQDDVKRLSDLGFEIGNHTWNHACAMHEMSDEDAAAEIDRLDDWLAAVGVPRPRSFAYPGGPFRENVVPLLKARGYTCARSVDQWGAPWLPGTVDPFNLPCRALTEGSDWQFYQYFQGPNPGDIPAGSVQIFCIHGVPDRVHPWVNTEPETFEKFLRFLHGRGYRCISLGDAVAER